LALGQYFFGYAIFNLLFKHALMALILIKLFNQAPLCVEGWDDALHEIGKLSCEIVLSPQNAMSLLKAVQNLPVLVITGAEDALISLRSAQTMASKFVDSVSVLAPCTRVDICCFQNSSIIRCFIRGVNLYHFISHPLGDGGSKKQNHCLIVISLGVLCQVFSNRTTNYP